MRCCYCSDLHLESQDFNWPLQGGDVLILAGDLCHARCLDPAAADKYSTAMRNRVHRFIDQAVARFSHVLLVPGNHDHYDGVFDDTPGLLARYLPGVTVLDDAAIVLDGVVFFGTTLWSDFENRNRQAMDRVRRRCGEFIFVKMRRVADSGPACLTKFQPEDALAAFDKATRALQATLASNAGRAVVVISHHAPSLKGLNVLHQGNGLDGAYASDLHPSMLQGVGTWVHGHTHVRRQYRVGETTVRANCRGFDASDRLPRSFSPNVCFEI